jgi:putative transcriptional regulator
MIKSRLKILMAERDIRSISELERKLKASGYAISRSSLNKIYHDHNINKTYLETILKLTKFFNCGLETLFSEVSDM